MVVTREEGFRIAVGKRTKSAIGRCALQEIGRQLVDAKAHERGDGAIERRIGKLEEFIRIDHDNPFPEELCRERIEPGRQRRVAERLLTELFDHDIAGAERGKLGFAPIAVHDDMELADAEAAIVIEKIWRDVGIVLADERDELMHLGRTTSLTRVGQYRLRGGGRQ